MEAAEIEGEQLKALKGAAAERLRIFQDLSLKHISEPTRHSMICLEVI